MKRIYLLINENNILFYFSDDSTLYGLFLFKNFKICDTIYFSIPQYFLDTLLFPINLIFCSFFSQKIQNKQTKTLQKYGVCFVLLNYSKHESCYRVWMVYPVSHTTDYLSLGGINYFPLLSAETLSVLCISFTCC